MSRLKAFTPVLLSVAELLTGPEGSPASIDMVDGSWSRLVGVTIGDAARMTRGGGYGEGLGGWRTQKGVHPTPLGLEMSVLVVSSGWEKSLPRHPGLLEHPPIRLPSFDLEAVRHEVARRVNRCNPGTWDEIVEQLSDAFHVFYND